jgi:hypothetical protein
LDTRILWEPEIFTEGVFGWGDFSGEGILLRGRDRNTFANSKGFNPMLKLLPKMPMNNNGRD